MVEDDQKWEKMGKLDEFPEGEKIEKELGNYHILILRQSDKWYAFEAMCPHMSRPLNDALVNDKILECIWHNMSFNIESGEIVNESGFFDIPDLRLFNIKVENKEVYVKKE